MVGQRIIMTVGCPGSGKSTWAAKNHLDFVTITLDDLRETLFRSRRNYHNVSRDNAAAPVLLHRAYDESLRCALDSGFNVLLPNTNLSVRGSTLIALNLAARHRIVPELVVFDVPLTELIQRNASRPEAHRIDSDFIYSTFCDLHADNAWWRTYVGPVRMIND